VWFLPKHSCLLLTTLGIQIAIGVFLNKEKPKSGVVEMIDIEAVFLEADQDQPVYIEWPEGMIDWGFILKDNVEEYCCELNKAMYGTIDAPLQWMKTFANFLTSDVMDMKQSLADLCMFYKKDGKMIWFYSWMSLWTMFYLEERKKWSSDSRQKFQQDSILLILESCKNIWVCGTSGEKTKT
jgi:hypothetical protein